MNAVSLFRYMLLWWHLTSVAIAQPPEMQVGEKFQLNGVEFLFDKAELTENSKDSLQALGSFLKDHHKYVVEIGVHTDTRVPNPYPYATRLDRNRARAIMHYLINRGISPARLTHKGYLDSEPIISEAEIAQMKTEEEKEAAHWQNRRVEVKIIATNHQMPKPNWFDRFLDTLNNEKIREFSSHRFSFPVPNIQFLYDRYELLINDKYNAQDSLMYIYKLLKKFPNTIIEIGGHRDSRGSNRYCRPLSQRRAEAVAKRLYEWGIPRERMVPKGYGEERPLISDREIQALKTEEEKEIAHAKNRRISICILSNDYVPVIWFSSQYSHQRFQPNDVIQVPHITFNSNKMDIDSK